MKRYFDINSFLQLLIISFLMLIIFIKIKNNEIVYYLHPKMIHFLLLSYAFLFIMALYLVLNLFTSEKPSKLKIYQIIFFSFLIFVLLLKPDSLFQQKAAELKGVKIGDKKVYKNSANDQSYDITNTKEMNNLNKSEKIDENPENSNSNNNQILEFTNINHKELVINIYQDPDRYENTKIKITGFVFSPENIEKELFIISRMMIICCAADGSIIGLIAKNPAKHKLLEGQWYEFTGIIKNQELQIHGEYHSTPVVNIDDYQKIKEPENPYIF